MNEQKFCKNCGSQLGDDSIVCTKCEMAIGKGSKFCPECGSPLDPTTGQCNQCEPQQQQQLPHNKNVRTIVEAWKNCFANTFKWSGRACRAEFWYFAILFGVTAFLYLFTYEVSESVGIGRIIFFIFLMWVAMAWVSVTIRRLHDIGKSGTYYWLFLLPNILTRIQQRIGNDDWDYVIVPISCVLKIIFIVWMCRKGVPGENEWGNNPKE